MDRRAFIATAFSGLAAAALGMPTQVEGPTVIRDTSWPMSLDRLERVRVALARNLEAVVWHGNYPPDSHDDEVDVFILPGERILTAVEVGEDRSRELEELNRKPGRLANLHLRGL